MENTGWEKLQEHHWGNAEKSIQIMIFTNDDDQDLKCIWVKILNDGEWVSNYFLYRVSDTKMTPFEFAESIVKRFKEFKKDVE